MRRGSSETRQERRHILTERVHSVATFHDDQRRQPGGRDPASDRRIIDGPQRETGDRIALERVRAEADDEQVRREARDRVQLERGQRLRSRSSGKRRRASLKARSASDEKSPFLHGLSTSCRKSRL